MTEKKKHNIFFSLKLINISNVTEAQLCGLITVSSELTEVKIEVVGCLVLGTHYTMITVVASFKDKGYASGVRH